MTTLYPGTNTTILRALFSAAEEAAYPTPPAGSGTPLVFDRTTNADLVADLCRSTDPYRLSADGVLTKDGAPVTIQPPATDQRAADTATVLQAFAAIVPDPAAQAALARILGVGG